MRNMDSIITGDDYLMANMYHLFGNAFCDMGYSNFFHVSHATYQSQDMNFYNQKNVNCAYYDKFNYSLKLNKKALAVASKIEDGKSLIPYIYSYI